MSISDVDALVTVSDTQRTKSKYDFYIEYKQQTEISTVTVEQDVSSTNIDISLLAGWQPEKIDAAKLMWQLFTIDNGYDPLFVCGLIGNMYGEGSFGLIEGSFVNRFSSCNLVPLSYSSRLGDIDAARTVCSYNTSASCGLGAIQWSFTRRADLLTFYESEYRKSGTFGLLELSKAELNYMLFELNGNYNSVYKTWVSMKSQCADAEDCIMRATGVVLREYEAPNGSGAIQRGSYIIPSDTHFYNDRYLPAIQFYKAVGGELK